MVQKKEQEKGTPAVLSTYGECLALLVVDGTLETHHLWRFRQASVLIRQHLRCSAGQNGTLKKQNLKLNAFSFSSYFLIYIYKLIW